MPRIHPRNALVGCLFLAALVIRTIHLGTSPLWLDELYGYQLAQRGFFTILRNSMFEPHPPLFYLIQWIGSGFGTLREEWAWRWTSVVAGAATVAVVYQLARLAADRYAALLVSAIVLLMPVSIYYSQDSRSYALLMLWSAIGAYLTVRVDQEPSQRRFWLMLALVSVVGVWTGYPYLMLCAMQALYLGLRHRGSRNWLWYVGAMVVGCVPLAPLAVNIFGVEQTLATTAERPQLNFVELARIVAGDPSRYGVHWEHIWLPSVYGLVMLLGVVGLARRRSARGMAYHVLQVGVPFVAIFAIAIPLLGIRVPLFQWKQFLILLPSVFVILAFGFDTIARRGRVGQLVALVLCGIVIAGSVDGIRRMWSTTKSPEGDAVLALRREVQPDDAVVSLHYSLNAALSFYLREYQPYTYPTVINGTVMFARTTSILRAGIDKAEYTSSLASIREHPRIWVLGTGAMPQDTVAAITVNCQKATEQVYGPFLMQLYDCGVAH